MKTLKCPLCGSLLKLDFNCKYICPNCELAAKSGISKEEALKRAEKLISQFPPIMKVWPGDEVLWGTDPVTVLDKDIQCGELMVINSQGNKYIIEQHVIEKWPWELKQKGGDNGQ